MNVLCLLMFVLVAKPGCAGSNKKAQNLGTPAYSAQEYALLELMEIERLQHAFPLTVRVSNNGIATRPAVRIFAYNDSECTNQIHTTFVGCSGYRGSNDTGTCQDALDVVSSDVPEWAPQCGNCNKGRAWIEFTVDEEMMCLNAQGLGHGKTGNWSNGIQVIYGDVLYEGRNDTDLWFYPVDCEGTWSQWTGCSKDCGAGNQTRDFTITTQAFGVGAKACPASPANQVCNAQPCNAPSGNTTFPDDTGTGDGIGDEESGDGTGERDAEVELPSVSMDLKGGDAAIKLSRTNDLNNSITIIPTKLSLKSDPSQAFNFSSVYWDYVQQTLSESGARVLKSNFTTTKDIGGYAATIEFVSELFQETATETNGGTNFIVNAHALKFSFALTNFPPVISGDGMDFSCIIKGMGDSQNIKWRSQNNQGIKIVDLKNGDIDLPTNAIINGVDTGKDGITIDLVKEDGQTVINFHFTSPSGSTPFSISYDPTAEVTACDDELQNGDEAGVDCGGSCPNVCVAQVSEDPHFIGFDGSHYDFQGMSREVFNLITDTWYQLNARFVAPPGKDQTYMGKLGFLVHSNKILVTPRKVTINGHQVDRQSVKPQRHKLSPAGMVIIHGMTTTVIAEAFVVTVTTQHTDDFVYLNIETEVKAHALYNPHGLLGQTAAFLVKKEEPRPVMLNHRDKYGEGFIEGSPTDYLVTDRDIFGIDFTFNRYYKGITSLQLRTRKLGAFLKKAARQRNVGEVESRTSRARWGFPVHAEATYLVEDEDKKK